VVKLEVTLDLTPAQLAEAFCELGDEEQADFFIAAARIALEKWTHPACMQWHAVGRHLRDCSCSTYDAQQMVSDIADALREAQR
jgi:hypothetical protein